MTYKPPSHRIAEQKRIDSQQAAAARERAAEVKKQGVQEISSAVEKLDFGSKELFLEVLKPAKYNPRKKFFREFIPSNSMTLHEYSTGNDSDRYRSYGIYENNGTPAERYKVAEVIGGIIVPGVFTRTSGGRDFSKTYYVNLAVSQDGRLWDDPKASYGQGAVYGVIGEPFLSQRGLTNMPGGSPSLIEIAKKISDFASRQA